MPQVFETNLIKIGSSIYLRIPKKIVDTLREQGVDLEKLARDKQSIIVRLSIKPVELSW